MIIVVQEISTQRTNQLVDRLISESVFHTAEMLVEMMQFGLGG